MLPGLFFARTQALPNIDVSPWASVLRVLIPFSLPNCVPWLRFSLRFRSTSIIRCRFQFFTIGQGFSAFRLQYFVVGFVLSISELIFHVQVRFFFYAFGVTHIRLRNRSFSFGISLPRSTTVLRRRVQCFVTGFSFFSSDGRFRLRFRFFTAGFIRIRFFVAGYNFS